MSQTGTFTAQKQPQQQVQQNTSGIDKTAMGFARSGNFNPSLSKPQPTTPNSNQGVDISSLARSSFGSTATGAVSSGGGGTASKKIDASQITSVNISLKMGEIMYSNPYNNSHGLLDSIKDDSKAILEGCCREVASTGEDLAKAVEQIDAYINSIAQAFQEMDKKIGTEISNLEISSRTSGSQSSGRNKFSGAF